MGCDLVKRDEDKIREAIVAANNSDVVILCMGIDASLEGEEGAVSDVNIGDKPDLELPDIQKKLMEKIIALGKPVIFVNVSGSCMNLTYADTNCDAVIQCFYPGAEGGNALADILYGKVSPSGRLPVTFYKSADDLPPFEDYSMENRTYKFFQGEPLYPFGYGLTYTDIQENWVDENTVEISNNGSFDTNYSVLKYEYIPHKSLCGIKKVFVKCGETVRVHFDK